VIAQESVTTLASAQAGSERISRAANTATRWPSSDADSPWKGLNDAAAHRVDRGPRPRGTDAYPFNGEATVLVPEPTVALQLGAALGAFALLRRRR
jgi:hypothetical protein